MRPLEASLSSLSFFEHGCIRQRRIVCVADWSVGVCDKTKRTTMSVFGVSTYLLVTRKGHTHIPFLRGSGFLLKYNVPAFYGHHVVTVGHLLRPTKFQHLFGHPRVFQSIGERHLTQKLIVFDAKTGKRKAMLPILPDGQTLFPNMDVGVGRVQDEKEIWKQMEIDFGAPAAAPMAAPVNDNEDGGKSSSGSDNAADLTSSSSSSSTATEAAAAAPRFPLVPYEIDERVLTGGSMFGERPDIPTFVVDPLETLGTMNDLEKGRLEEEQRQRWLQKQKLSAATLPTVTLGEQVVIVGMVCADDDDVTDSVEMKEKSVTATCRAAMVSAEFGPVILASIDDEKEVSPSMSGGVVLRKSSGKAIGVYVAPCRRTAATEDEKKLREELKMNAQTPTPKYRGINASDAEETPHHKFFGMPDTKWADREAKKKTGEDGPDLGEMAKQQLKLSKQLLSDPFLDISDNKALLESIPGPMVAFVGLKEFERAMRLTETI